MPKLPPRRLLIIVVVMLIPASLLPASVAGRIAALPAAAVKVLLSPMTGAFKTFSGTLRPGLRLAVKAGSYEALRGERDLALKRIRELELEVGDLRERLNKLTEAQVIGVRLIEARVLSYSNDLANPVLIINKGTAKRVTRQLAVVWGIQLVGVVQAADHFSAEVSPITAPGTGMWVQIAPPDPSSAPRLSEQLHLSPDDGSEFYLDVDEDDPIQEDDLAHLADTEGSWPPEAHGYVIGVVVRIETHPEKPMLLKRAFVRPIMDLPHLNRVAVLEPVEVAEGG